MWQDCTWYSTKIPGSCFNQPSIQYHFHRKHHPTLKAELQMVSRPDFPLFSENIQTQSSSPRDLPHKTLPTPTIIYDICNFCIIFITQNTPSIFPDVFTSMHLHHGLCLMTCSLVGTTCHLYLNGKRKKTHRENTSSGQWRTTSHNIHVCTDTVRPLPIAAK